MKTKKILFVTICLIILLAPNVALAADAFTYGNYTYTIEKVNLKTESFTVDDEFIKIDEEGNYIFKNFSKDEVYKVNEKECISMTNEEILELHNNEYHKYIDVQDYDIYEVKEIYYSDTQKVKTTDTEINPNKKYWKATGANNNGVITDFVTVSNPDILELATYYEDKLLRYPTSTKIDDKVIYYTKDKLTGAFEKVDNPISDNVDKYRIEIDNNNDARVTKKIGALNSTAFEKILENYYICAIHKDEVANEMLVSLSNGYDTAIYTTEGTLIIEFKGIDLIEFEVYSKSLFAIKDEDGPFKIIDKDKNVIFESEKLPMLYEIKYENNTYYLVSYDENGNVKFYNMHKKESEGDSVDSQYYKLNVSGDVEVSGDNILIDEDGQTWIKKGNSVIYIILKDGYVFTAETEVVTTGGTVTKKDDGTYELKGISDEVTITAQTELYKYFNIKEGNNQTWNGKGDIRIVSDGDYAKLINVLCGEKDANAISLIDENVDYTAKNGSTIITIKESYLKKLAEGEYQIAMVYSNGEATAYFTVANVKSEQNKEDSEDSKADETIVDTSKNDDKAENDKVENDNNNKTNNPQTGDNILLYIGLSLISVVGILTTTKFRKNAK